MKGERVVHDYVAKVTYMLYISNLVKLRPDSIWAACNPQGESISALLALILQSFSGLSYAVAIGM